LFIVAIPHHPHRPRSSTDSTRVDDALLMNDDDDDDLLMMMNDDSA